MAITATGQQLDDSAAIISATVNGYQTTASMNIASGDAVVVAIRTAPGGVAVVTGMSDDGGNNYTQASVDTGSDPHMAIWYCLNCAAKTGAKITLAGSGTFSFGWLHAAAFAGVKTTGALDVSACEFRNPGGSPTTHDSSAFSADETTSVIVMWVGSNNFLTYTAGSGFTLLSGTLGNSGGSHFGGSEYKVLTTAWTTTAASFTASSGYDGWEIGHIVLRAATGGGGGKATKNTKSFPLGQERGVNRRTSTANG